MGEAKNEFGAGRDIYEVANQLAGWVGPTTDEALAKFLLREAEEADKLAKEIESLRRVIRVLVGESQ